MHGLRKKILGENGVKRIENREKIANGDKIMNE